MFKKCKIGINFQKFGKTIRITMKENETNTKNNANDMTNFFQKQQSAKKEK